MNALFRFRVAPALVLGISAVMAGCARAPSEPPPAPVAVAVSRPIEREVTDFTDFTGRTAAVDTVEVRARVWGYLDKINFKEGAMVAKGDVLFQIDPRPYRASLSQAEGNLASIQARLKRLDADLTRVQKLPPGSVSPQELDKYTGDRAEAAASLEASKAAVEQAKLDLEYTRVVAPIAGRIGRHLITAGNLIQSGSMGSVPLTTIVSVDPVYAYFDVDEATVLRVRQMVREGKTDSPREGGVPVSMGLANEAGFPHRGIINFVDNQLAPRTGTIRVRGVFANKDQVLLPGVFARVRVPVGRLHKAVLVSERALDSDQGQRVVYVVNDRNEVTVRPVQLGALHDGLREITGGLKPGERVIVVGLQQVRPGVAVEPKLVDMPGGK